MCNVYDGKILFPEQLRIRTDWFTGSLTAARQPNVSDPITRDTVKIPRGYWKITIPQMKLSDISP